MSQSIEIFGGIGVGKSTLIRHEGLVSSQDVLREHLDRLLVERIRRRILVPVPTTLLRPFRDSMVYGHEEEAMGAFTETWREFADLCLFVIFNSPISAERRIRCYRFLMKAVLGWWLVEEREGMVWDESFAKLTMYACGMAPAFADEYFRDMVAAMPKRDRYILVDGRPEQSLAGQIKRGKAPNDMSPSEREDRLRSAAKYREVAKRLSEELQATGHAVEERSSPL